MALRIRKSGRIFCAALCQEESGDTYIDDGLHYELSVVRKVLVSEPLPKHTETGEWWWRGNVPSNVNIDSFYEFPSLSG